MQILAIIIKKGYHIQGICITNYHMSNSIECDGISIMLTFKK